ncbi:uncharacterized protein LOC103695885 isoform X5 [Phoenix dactylifera]|uniref:Uncharacterized protein LOC103695885 isoform X5 n=1 Tax=Phoenix dactylifera TaxID=42345 RepID=A0A8B9ABQ0_PHODC|nr:uncharacterized protein LOC103695885 isoform X5 [Phoenix dactylifera]
MAVQALRLISFKLRKEWDFSVDPCSGRQGWLEPTGSFAKASNVTCRGNTTSNICHVTSLCSLLKSQITGVLQEILHGTISVDPFQLPGLCLLSRFYLFWEIGSQGASRGAWKNYDPSVPRHTGDFDAGALSSYLLHIGISNATESLSLERRWEVPSAANYRELGSTDLYAFPECS